MFLFHSFYLIWTTHVSDRVATDTHHSAGQPCEVWRFPIFKRTNDCLLRYIHTYGDIHSRKLIYIDVHRRTLIDIHWRTVSYIDWHTLTYIDWHTLTYIDVHWLTYIDVHWHTLIDIHWHTLTHIDGPLSRSWLPMVVAWESFWVTWMLSSVSSVDER